MTDRAGGWSGLSDPMKSGGLTAVLDGPLVGTRGVECGSNPGAIRLSASRLRRSFSSSRARKYASRRAACAASVERRASSTFITRDSSVNGYTNFRAEISRERHWLTACTHVWIYGVGQGVYVLG